jgi:hypothetical protein
MSLSAGHRELEGLHAFGRIGLQHYFVLCDQQYLHFGLCEKPRYPCVRIFFPVEQRRADPCSEKVKSGSQGVVGRELAVRPAPCA